MDRVAVVLPPRERFSPDSSGAIGLQVHLLATVSPGCRVVGSSCARPFDDVPFDRVRPLWWPPTRIGRYARAVSTAVADAELIEVHNRPDVAMRLARSLPGRRVSLMLHNDPRTMTGLRSPADRRAAAARLAGIGCVSAELSRIFSSGLAVSPAVVLPNAIDLAAIPRDVSRETLILFAGRMVADKGADAFVEAAACALQSLPGWRAEMIGADRFGPDSPDTPFLTALQHRAHAGDVRMTGYRSHADVLQAMARAAIVVVPSRWNEPFGLTALEAMACGAALVCSNRGGLAEVVGGAVPPTDPDDIPALTARLVALATQPQARAAIGAAGQARAAAFSLSVAAPRLAAWRADLLRPESRRDEPHIRATTAKA